MTSRAVAVLAAWMALHPGSVRAEGAPSQPAAPPPDRYTVMHLPNDPRLFIFDPATARMWVLVSEAMPPYFQEVRYIHISQDHRQYRTVQPPPPGVDTPE